MQIIFIARAIFMISSFGSAQSKRQLCNFYYPPVRRSVISFGIRHRTMFGCIIRQKTRKMFFIKEVYVCRRTRRNMEKSGFAYTVLKTTLQLRKYLLNFFCRFRSFIFLLTLARQGYIQSMMFSKLINSQSPKYKQCSLNGEHCLFTASLSYKFCGKVMCGGPFTVRTTCPYIILFSIILTKLTRKSVDSLYSVD